MRLRHLAAASFALAAASAGAACVLDIPDVVTPDAGDATATDAAAPDADAGAGDASSDAVIDVPIPSCEAGACAAPAGFSPVFVAFGDTKPSCPAPWTTTDLVADPQAPASGACTCNCTTTAPPTCVPQSLTTHTSGMPTCTNSFATVVDGGCNSISFGLQSYVQADPMPTATPGTCSSTAVVNASKVATTRARLCTDTTCGACSAPNGFTLCYEKAGSAACPNNMTAHAVGGSVALDCAACSACSLSSGTCEGTVEYFSDLNCSNPIGGTIPVDGGCDYNGQKNGTARSLRYTASPTGVACTPGTTSVSSVGVTSPITVCCP